MKAHTIINADEVIPHLVGFSTVTTRDHSYLKKPTCNNNTIYIFDKGNNDYKAFEHFTVHHTSFVSCIMMIITYYCNIKLDI